MAGVTGINSNDWFKKSYCEWNNDQEIKVWATHYSKAMKFDSPRRSQCLICWDEKGYLKGRPCEAAPWRCAVWTLCERELFYHYRKIYNIMGRYITFEYNSIDLVFKNMACFEKTSLINFHKLNWLAFQT